jgi:ATP-dependent DNA helicase RecG
LKIWNPAVLPDGWTVKTLLAAHASTPFNPAIANVVFRSGEIEIWGRGIQRIFAACKEAGVPRPTLTFDGTGLAIEFRHAREYLHAVAAGVGQVVTPPPAPENGGRLESQPESQPESQLESQLGSNLKARVIQLLRVSPKAKKELSLALGQKSVSGPLHQAVRDLVSDGWIVSTHPDQPKSRLQKYRLAEKGRTLFAVPPQP